jgi:hypothetical protein
VVDVRVGVGALGRDEPEDDVQRSTHRRNAKGEGRRAKCAACATSHRKHDAPHAARSVQHTTCDVWHATYERGTTLGQATVMSMARHTMRRSHNCAGALRVTDHGQPLAHRVSMNL